MQTSILEALRWRYAVQSFDPSKMVSSEDLNVILEAGRLTPSSFGLEPWKFLVIENQEIREKLQAVAYNQSKVTDASHLIVLARRTDMRANGVTDRITRTAKIQHQEVGSLDGFKQMLDGVVAGRDDAALDAWNARQVYIALGVMMATASVLNIDNAAMEGFDEAGVNAVLGLGERSLSATAMLTLGYRGNDETASRPKVRRSLEDVVEFIR